MSFDPLEALISVLHGAPPDEVLAEVAAAGGRWEELRAEDRELAFIVSGGQVEVELRTRDGELLGRLPPSAALAVAAGRSLTDVSLRS